MKVEIETNLDQCPGLLTTLSLWGKLMTDEIVLGAGPHPDFRKLAASKRKCVEDWWAGDPRDHAPLGETVWHYDAASALEGYFHDMGGVANISFTAKDCGEGGVEVMTDYPYDKLTDLEFRSKLTSLWEVYLCNLERWSRLVILFMARKMYIVSSLYLMQNLKTSWAPRLFRFVRIMDRKVYAANQEEWSDWTEIRRLK